MCVSEYISVWWMHKTWNPGSQTPPCNIYTHGKIVCVYIYIYIYIYIYTHTHTDNKGVCVHMKKIYEIIKTENTKFRLVGWLGSMANQPL